MALVYQAIVAVRREAKKCKLKFQHAPTMHADEYLAPFCNIIRALDALAAGAAA